MVSYRRIPLTSLHLEDPVDFSEPPFASFRPPLPFRPSFGGPLSFLALSL